MLIHVITTYSALSILLLTLALQYEGELAVKEAFPEATIVRPAKLFGNNDRLLTWIALMATRTGRVPLVS